MVLLEPNAVWFWWQRCHFWIWWLVKLRDFLKSYLEMISRKKSLGLCVPGGGKVECWGKKGTEALMWVQKEAFIHQRNSVVSRKYFMKPFSLNLLDGWGDEGAHGRAQCFCFTDKHAGIRCCFLMFSLARWCLVLLFLCCPAGCHWVQGKQNLSIMLGITQKSNPWHLQVAYEMSLPAVAAGTVSLWEQFSPCLAEISPWHHDFGTWQKVQGSTGQPSPSVSLLHLEECPADKSLELQSSPEMQPIRDSNLN